MLFALKRKKKQTNSEEPARHFLFPNSEGAEQHPDFKKKILFLKKKNLFLFQMPINLKEDNSGSICWGRKSGASYTLPSMYESASIIKGKKKSEPFFSPFNHFFWPKVLVLSLLQARRNNNRLPFRNHDSRHTLVFAQTSHTKNDGLGHMSRPKRKFFKKENPPNPKQ